MAQKLAAGDWVLVPRTRLILDDTGQPIDPQLAISDQRVQAESVFYRTRVVEVKTVPGPKGPLRTGSISVNGFDGSIVTLHARDAQRHCAGKVGIIIVDDGAARLNPSGGMLVYLKDAYLNYLNLLFSNESVVVLAASNPAALAAQWKIHGADIGFVSIVSHGAAGGEGLVFSGGEVISGSDLVNDILIPLGDPKFFVSSACNSGQEAFAGPFSSARMLCSGFIGPEEPIHSAIACQFTSTFFTYRLLAGLGAQESWTRSSTSLPKCNRFKYWKKGQPVPYSN
jgi:hypothetical protein